MGFQEKKSILHLYLTKNYYHEKSIVIRNSTKINILEIINFTFILILDFNK